MEKIEELRIARSSAWRELGKINSMFKGIQITYLELEHQLKVARATYERIDYQLAEIDGRLERLAAAKAKEEGGKPRRKPPMPELTAEQLKLIAFELGIDLNAVSEEVNEKEVEDE